MQCICFADEMFGDPRALDVFLAVLSRKNEAKRIQIEAIIGWDT